MRVGTARATLVVLWGNYGPFGALNRKKWTSFQALPVLSGVNRQRGGVPREWLDARAPQKCASAIGVGRAHAGLSTVIGRAAERERPEARGWGSVAGGDMGLVYRARASPPRTRRP